MKINRYQLLGVSVDAMTDSDLYELMAEAVTANRRYVFANHNLHSIYLEHHDPRFAELYRRSDCVYIDGMPVVFAAKMLGYPVRPEHRTTLLDWFDRLVAETARRGWSMFYLGCKPGVAEKGAEILRQRYPGLRLATHHGYFDVARDSEENRRVLETINAFRPNVLMVGMGMPRQEHWILENLEAISANSIYNSGACMEWIVGDIPMPPAWAGPLGLYGPLRLRYEPGRLWKRYLVEPWFLLPLFLRDLLLMPLRSRRRVSASAPASGKPLEEHQQAQAD